MEKIKPCPFCGAGQNKIFYRWQGTRYGVYAIWIECECCGARTKAAYKKEDPKDLDEKTWYAVEAAWNRRTKAKRKTAEEVE